MLGISVHRPCNNFHQMGVRMQRWIASVVGSVMIVLCGFTHSSAQAPSLVGGGLTALPTVSLGPDRLTNGGFETLSGGLPASWSAGSGWAVDQLVKHSGTFSYRATGSFSTSSQAVQVRRGTYRLSGWVRTQGVGSGTTNGVRLQFDFRPAHQLLVRPRRSIAGTRDWTRFELTNIVVTQPATVTIKLENFNSSGGTGLVRRRPARGAAGPVRGRLHALPELPRHALRRRPVDHAVRRRA